MKTRWMEVAWISIIFIGAVAVLVVGHDLYKILTPPPHRYTCQEVLGPHPRLGYYAIIPPRWKVTMAISFDGQERPDFRVWDEQGRLVCDEQGKDVQ